MIDAEELRLPGMIVKPDGTVEYNEVAKALMRRKVIAGRRILRKMGFHIPRNKDGR